MPAIELSDIFRDMVRQDWNKGPGAVLEQVIYEAWNHLGEDEEDEEETESRREILRYLIQQYWNSGPDVFFERFAYWLNRNARVSS